MMKNDAERIAAAVHQLRPDWSAGTVLALIGQHLSDRPRRDVAVALAWVASEPTATSPADVLKMGAWWRAAAVDGARVRRPEPAPSERCSICAESRKRCREVWSDDHEFRPCSQPPERVDTRATSAALKDLARDARSTTAEPAMERPAPPSNPRVDALRRAKARAVAAAPAPVGTPEPDPAS